MTSQQLLMIEHLRRAILQQDPVLIRNSGGGNQAVLLNTTPAPDQAVGTSTAQAPVLNRPCQRLDELVYSYKVKIINPVKKSDVIVRQLHGFKKKFESVTAMRAQLVEEFKDQVPNSLDFSVGYFDGSQQAKLWLVTQDDIDGMYSKYKTGGSIFLWCDGRRSEEERLQCNAKRKRDSAGKAETRQDKEDEVDATFKKLREKHGQTTDTPRLRLWSRMICSGIHDDYDTPPDIPAFTGVTPKRPRKDSLSSALTGAAVAFAQTLSTGSTSGTATDLSLKHSTTLSASPTKAAELRMKNLEQLRYLHQLFDDGILSEDEFVRLKQNILSSLYKL